VQSIRSFHSRDAASLRPMLQALAVNMKPITALFTSALASPVCVILFFVGSQVGEVPSVVALIKEAGSLFLAALVYSCFFTFTVGLISYSLVKKYLGIRWLSINIGALGAVALPAFAIYLFDKDAAFMFTLAAPFAFLNANSMWLLLAVTANKSNKSPAAQAGTR